MSAFLVVELVVIIELIVLNEKLETNYRLNAIFLCGFFLNFLEKIFAKLKSKIGVCLCLFVYV